MAVIATAGHVDHGKSTLVRLLTGMEPDRWAEERQRGLTIDLGFAWTDVDGHRVALVDVPGHERFVGSMLAGVGPVAGVMFVVAADSGWARQSEEHAQAISALGLGDVLLVVTRCDLAPGGPAVEAAQQRLTALGTPPAETVSVSGRTGEGVDALRAALGRLAERIGEADAQAPPRLWVDRAFTIRGVGTVVTGTLPAGTVRPDDELELRDRLVTVRGVQTCGESVSEVIGPARVALNLRGVAVSEVRRGDQILAPGWLTSASFLDVALTSPHDHPASRLPSQATLHLGTASQTVRLRPLGESHARLRLSRPLPLALGDRGLLRDPGRHEIVSGVTVRALDPEPLARRGAARARGLDLREGRPGGQAQPTAPAGPSGQWSAGTQALLDWLAAHPFQAPTREDLLRWGPRSFELAEAERAGLVLRMAGLVVAGNTLRRAAEAIRDLPQPFTVGDVARALGTSRRVAVPVLERLDAALVTRRLPDGGRVLRP